MVLDVVRFHSMEFIYLTCDESNIASYKTIEKIGAELVEICDVPKKYFGWSEVWRAKGFINSILIKTKSIKDKTTMDNYKQLIIIKGEPKDDIIRCYYDKVKKKQAVVFNNNPTTYYLL